ncbi:uncharacterized protein LOC129733322 [Wyeomyia smithii]|uniref:uncharacterized protein LOC129733322 n=1 Tax=Wyeomyia smithii TaxID=174621 RepID=UPI002467FCEA|nr:uncharacterized protein LOC129733322 [Wyeomyia smithii]
MKMFIVLLVAALAVSTHGVYVPAALPTYAAGWNSWNGAASYPHASLLQGVPYPLQNEWNGGNSYGIDANPWGLPWGTYGAGPYGWGQQNIANTLVPVAQPFALAAGPGFIAPVSFRKTSIL